MIEPIAVVAAAIVRDGSVLIAHRAQRPRGWEFPGGKVEPGESESDALRRECREELGVEVAPGAVLAVADDGRIRLTLIAATLRDGEPRAGADHDRVRWLEVDELHTAELEWLLLDRELLAILRKANRPGRL